MHVTAWTLSPQTDQICLDSNPWVHLHPAYLLWLPLMNRYTCSRWVLTGWFCQVRAGVSSTPFSPSSPPHAAALRRAEAWRRTPAELWRKRPRCRRWGLPAAPARRRRTAGAWTCSWWSWKQPPPRYQCIQVQWAECTHLRSAYITHGLTLSRGYVRKPGLYLTGGQGFDPRKR